MNSAPVAVVAGAGGFIGGHLVARLRGDGYRVRAMDCKPLERWHQRHPDVDNQVADLSILDCARAAVRGASVVFNLAADMGGIGFIAQHKARCMLSVLINTHLLLASRDVGVDRYFFASSACVYPTMLQATSEVTALREDAAYPALPEDGYGWEKLFSERMCRHFTEDFGLATRVARLHNVYGPFGTWRGGREKAPASICRKVAHAALTVQPTIEVWGDGRQTRSFTYIDDCVEGICRIMASDLSEPVNLGSGELVTIDELVRLAAAVAGVTVTSVYDRAAPQGVRGRNSDNTLIQARLGWQPTTTLAEGIVPTYHWIHDQMTLALPGSRRP